MPRWRLGPAAVAVGLLGAVALGAAHGASAPDRASLRLSAGSGLDRSAAAAVQDAAGFTALRFADARHGWLSDSNGILATTDGGQTWRRQYTSEPIHAFAALDPQLAWAVGARSVLGTADGGQHWEVLATPSVPLSRVDFATARRGWGIAAASSQGPYAPIPAGAVVATDDGGRTWTPRPAPGPAQTLCFRHPERGWAAGHTTVWRTLDAGRTWQAVLTSPAAEGLPATADALTPFAADVQCAADAVAWVLFTGPGAMHQAGWALYRTEDGGASWTPLVTSGQFFPPVGAPASQGGWSAVRLAAVDARTAYLAGVCAPCSLPGTQEQGTVSIGAARADRQSWQVYASIPGLSGPGLSAFPPVLTFVTPERGWLAAASAGRALFTTDNGGAAWQPVPVVEE
ncbi:MAG TPA: hypothetical protein VFB73_11100 [Chloroflexota bacterium]|nr:hypothetical protein [Chloroflexota bacterium]